MLSGLYTAVNNFNRAIDGAMSNAQNIAKNIVNEAVTTSVNVVRTYTGDSGSNGGSNSVTITETVTTIHSGSYNKNAPAPTPTPRPSATPMPSLAPVPLPSNVPSGNVLHITDNRNSNTNWFFGGASFPAGVYRIVAQGWHTYWSPTPSVVSYANDSNDPVLFAAWCANAVHFRSGSFDYNMPLLRTSPGVLELKHQGGSIGVWFKDYPYWDNAADLTYALQYVGALPSDATDSDGDGLPDDVETHGIEDGLGHKWYTDPHNADSDGDGLKDGQEVGVYMTTNGMKYFLITSNPKNIDTDGDGLSDDIEYYEDTDPKIGDTDDDGLNDGIEYNLGTDPFIIDSDNDGYSDGFEYYHGYDPTVAEDHMDPLLISREIVLGAIFGEYYSDDPGHGNIFYLVGWMASGYIVLGDIRDISHSISNGDSLGTALNGVAFAPIFGDALKTSDIIGKFTAKHPGCIVGVAMFIGKYAPWKSADDALEGVKAVHGKEVVQRLLNNGVTKDTLITLSKRGEKLTDFEKLMNVHGISADDLLKYSDKKVSLGKLLSLLDNVKNKAFTGAWSPGLFRDALVNLNAHFTKHAKEFGYSGYAGDIVQKQEYVDKAIALINRVDSVEKYYHKADNTIIIFDSAANEWVQGTIKGEVKTYFKPIKGYVQKQIDNGQLVKLI